MYLMALAIVKICIKNDEDEIFFTIVEAEVAIVETTFD